MLWRSSSKKTPVVIHRAIFGTFDRFTAFLLEETKGILPLWLSPVQINIIPVSLEHHLDYCYELKNKFQELGIRVEVDARNEKLGYKMRESQMKKIPHTLVIGDNELKNQSINYRFYGSNETKELGINEYIELVCNLIKEKK